MFSSRRLGYVDGTAAPVATSSKNKSASRFLASTLALPSCDPLPDASPCVLPLCQELCSKDHPPSIDHDEIDAILRHLLQSAEEQDEAEGQGIPTPTPTLADLPAALSGGAAGTAAGYQNDQSGARAGSSAADGLDEQGQTSKWTQVYPREPGPDESTTVEEGAGRSSEGDILPVPRSPFDGASEAWHPGARSTSVPKRQGEGAEEHDESLWAWARQGGAPIGRLVSLLSLSVANCGETRDARARCYALGYAPELYAPRKRRGVHSLPLRASCALVLC